jgi:hypothetical protein
LILGNIVVVLEWLVVLDNEGPVILDNIAEVAV